MRKNIFNKINELIMLQITFKAVNKKLNNAMRSFIVHFRLPVF